MPYNRLTPEGAAKHREQVKAWQRRRVEEGRCVSCGELHNKISKKTKQRSRRCQKCTDRDYNTEKKRTNTYVTPKQAQEYLEVTTLESVEPKKFSILDTNRPNIPIHHDRCGCPRCFMYNRWKEGS